jgi:hypothetical protein
MRIRFAAPVLAIFLLAGCGGASPGASSNSGPTQKPATAAPAGQVDCAALSTAAQQLFAIQFLAQLTTPDTVEAIKSHAVGNLDLDAFLAAMSELHALDAYSSALGDPKAAIEKYEKAAQAAKVLFAMDPVTQAAIDAYNQENVGSIPDFLGHQIAISTAMDAAGC